MYICMYVKAKTIRVISLVKVHVQCQLGCDYLTVLLTKRPCDEVTRRMLFYRSAGSAKSLVSLFCTSRGAIINT